MEEYREGKSGVNVKRLVKNIADQYPFEPQKAAIIELIANSLDARASLIEIVLDKEEGILSLKDNGIGMDKGAFQEYHNFASSTKTRGSGIGFAGQGAKLALNFCSKVLSETMSSNYKGYSEWFLKGNDAPYKIFDNQIFSLDTFGTKVTLYLNKEAIEFYTKELIEEIIYEHYFPLIDPNLKNVYKTLYKEYIKILLNGEEILLDKSIEDMMEDKKDIIISIYHKPKAVGKIGIIRNTEVEFPGIMVCTFGKVIERTYFKKEPREKEKIMGWIEAPYLIEAVTTDKCRFQAGNKIWEGFFKKAQSEFSKYLESIGLLERTIRRELNYSNLEKEINHILKNLPEFSFFGSKVEKSVSIPNPDGEDKKLGNGTQKVSGTAGGETEGGGISVFPGDQSGKAPTTESGEGIKAEARTRTIRSGIKIAEDERTDLEQEAWFDGETVTVNKSHPAYIKAKNKELLNYHILKCVIMELIKFTLEKDPAPSYCRVFELQNKFFRLWGESDNV
ncbi:MAG TPA: ATP-binding protein [bacterium]|nr:ATP-binding protein [bacterium]